MKSERELQDETSLVDAVQVAVSQYMRSEGYWDIINKLRLVHPDISKALDAFMEKSFLEGRIRGTISTYPGEYPYLPSELAKVCYERTFGRNLVERAEEVHQMKD